MDARPPRTGKNEPGPWPDAPALPEQPSPDPAGAQRDAFARELHDEFGQRLALLKMHCHKLRPFIDHPGADAWQAAEAEIDALIAHVRSMSGSLYPAELSRLGLAGAIDVLLSRHLGPAGVDWRFECDEAPGVVDDSVGLALYRVTQESVTNIVRHAAARRVTVRLGQVAGGSSVQLLIGDDGVGCVRSARDGGGAGNGQAGMRLRMEQVGGTLDVSSSERGTSVLATVPLARAQ